MDTAQIVKEKLKKLATSERAKTNQWFFKTGPGDYGEGDKFIGVTVPQIRKIAKDFFKLPIKEIEVLLKSPIHEERLTALIILVNKFKQSSELEKENLYDFYLKHIKWINNWDLVDTSAEYIVGSFLENKSKKTLITLASSTNIWERRIAMISTFHFIKKGKYKDAFVIAELLLNDDHDLIQKAVGWMLREIGKRCGEEIEEEFLSAHYKSMPRTMLRYSIERMSVEKKAHYMLK